MTTLLLTTFAIMLASLSGVVIVWLGAGTWIQKHLGYLTSLAAGVFLVVSGRIFLHTLEIAPSAWTAVLYVLAGAVIAYSIFQLMPLFHHHHVDDCEDEHSRLDVRRILFGDGLHNIGDGLLLAITFSTSAATGLIAGVGVLVHEIVQEVSEFFVLKESGMSTKEALLKNFAVSATMLIGVAVGLFATESAEALVLPLLGITAGVFLVIVANDLIPHSIDEARRRNDLTAHIGWFAFGLILMAGVMILVGEVH